MIRNKSITLFEEAQKNIPGGVNSPVRSFGQVGGTPVFMKRADGAYLYDEDDNAYIDYINSWGPMILGHQHSSVVSAVEKQIKKAFSFGTPTSAEVEMAKLVKLMVPNIEMVRMVSSGTEACMSAIRLARGFTKKTKIIKFEGHYHGHADMFLKKAGSGMATFNIKVENGITTAVTDDTIVLPFNDFEVIEKTLDTYKDEIASIIIEPVAGNMGCILPKDNYLEYLRKICSDNNIVLIFDEVMTGFRLAKGGAQERLNVRADLVTFGKIIGGGMPVGAFGGRKDIMSLLAPLGTVYQAGTLSGNPIAMSAGIATLTELNENANIYTSLQDKGDWLAANMSESLQAQNIPHQINHIGSMISVHFCENPVTDFQTASAGNNDRFKRFFHHHLTNGVYLPPSAFESWFLSNSITKTELEKTIGVCNTFRV